MGFRYKYNIVWCLCLELWHHIFTCWMSTSYGKYTCKYSVKTCISYWGQLRKTSGIFNISIFWHSNVYLYFWTYMYYSKVKQNFHTCQNITVWIVSHFSKLSFGVWYEWMYHWIFTVNIVKLRLMLFVMFCTHVRNTFLCKYCIQ